MSPSRIVALVISGALAWACHEAPSGWEPPEEAPLPSGPRQLTFNIGDDRSPMWSSDGETVVYVAEGFGDLARSDGVLVSIPRAGGTVSSVFPILQPGNALAPAVHVPALDPAGARIAYLQLLSGGETVCSTGTVSCDATDDPTPPPSLRVARIRVRSIGATTSPDGDPTLDLAYDGVEFDPTRRPFGLTGVWLTRLHPFQALFNEESVLPSRPAWDPSGARMVTSDGLRLLTWGPGDGAASPIPGTEEGTSPAWSPTGDRIAFSRLDRGPEFTTTCQHLIVGPGGVGVSCVEERTQWQIWRSMIVLIDPEGGQTEELAEGADPAWSPDGEWVYFARADGIWRVRASGPSLERVPGTDGGSQPAVSPDGSELAFTIRDETGKGDIWIVPLMP